MKNLFKARFKAVFLCFLSVTAIVSGSMSVYSGAIPGNPDGKMAIPQEARQEDVSKPDHVIGTGTPESCTSEAFIQAVAKGGKIVFNGGSKPFTLTLDRCAKIFNNANPDVIIDGGGLVTLSGGGKTRILYMNTCDPNQVWTTDHAQNQDYPRLTVQNLTFTHGNATADTVYDGGGAIWVRGGRFKVVNCLFTNNVCASTGADVGGGALRVFDQYEDLPVYVVNSTFGGGKGLGNVGANGGALSSIGVSWTIINSVFSYNEAIGQGGNPAKPGTSGGGSGGAIYNDGNKMTLSLSGTRIENNRVNAYGSGIFFVTNDHTGDIKLDNTTVENNIGGSWYPVMSGISMHADTKLTIANTVPSSANQPSAAPVSAAVRINGKDMALEAYNIDNSNYFKLRDLAMLLSGSSKQFEITWNDSERTMTLASGKAYFPIGGELTLPGASQSQPYRQTQPNIMLDGRSITLTAYTINNSNYFKLRDIAAQIGFNVSWDEAADRIHINTPTN